MSKPISFDNFYASSSFFTPSNDSPSMDTTSFSPYTYTRNTTIAQSELPSITPRSYGFRGYLHSPSALYSISQSPYSNTDDSVGYIVGMLKDLERESELCKNYNCCGLHLPNLHNLIEHFEDAHVVTVYGSSMHETQKQIKIPFNPTFRGRPVLDASLDFPPSTNLASTSQAQRSNLVSQGPFQNSADGEMEFEIDLEDNPTWSHPPSTLSNHSSPSSGGSTPPDTPISTPLSAYPSSPYNFLDQLPTGYLSYNATPFSSQPPSPTSSSDNVDHADHPTRPNFASYRSDSTIKNPGDAFNAYARYSQDYSSRLPGAQSNAASVDEANVYVVDQQWQQSMESQGPCVPPALLFSSGMRTPANTPISSRVSTPSYSTQLHTVSTPSGSPPPVSASASSSALSASSADLSSGSNTARNPSSYILSKPFRCPKPNCSKSYKQANGLKYHLTHGQCNFLPPKDAVHIQDVINEREGELNQTLGGSSVLEMSEADLREVEREAEKRVRPFACTVGQCTRRYKNMNGLRYHYSHTGDHGAIGLALLASGQHECLSNGRKSEDREGRRKHPYSKYSSSVPVSRAGSVSRVGSPNPMHYASGSSQGPSTTTNPIHATPVQNTQQMQFAQQQMALYAQAQMQYLQQQQTVAQQQAQREYADVQAQAQAQFAAMIDGHQKSSSNPRA